MSQGTQVDESGVGAQTKRLSKLASSVRQLKDEKEDAEEKRKERQQKNQAFKEVKSAISDAENVYNVLQRAVDLVEVLDAPVPERDIEDTLHKYRPKIRSFQAKTYDDFENVSDISSVRTDFDEFESALSGHKDDVKSNLSSAAKTELTNLETLESILRIPDVGSQEDSDAVQNYRSKLDSLNRGQLIDADELEAAQKDYDAVDIDIETVRDNYGLSEDAGDLLLRFLKNEEVTLAGVDGSVLDELKALEEFSERLTIQF
jgi:uncharacterized phage infection (PIP) family protein YhgE